MFDEEKKYIKQLSLKENSLKSISFSVLKMNELTIYFTWKTTNYDSFYNERDNFRNNILIYLTKKYFVLNKSKSNQNKYIFVKNNINI